MGWKLWHVPNVGCTWQYQNGVLCRENGVLRMIYFTRDRRRQMESDFFICSIWNAFGCAWFVMSSVVLITGLWWRIVWLFSLLLFQRSPLFFSYCGSNGIRLDVMRVWMGDDGFDDNGSVGDGGMCDGDWFRGVDGMEDADAVSTSCSMSWWVGPLPSSTSCTPFNGRECKVCFVVGRGWMYVME